MKSHRKQKKTRARPKKPTDKQSRSIPTARQAILYAVAAGRCEFNRCNTSLVAHAITGADGNFAQMGHIYAFSEGGPRAKSLGRPKAVHALSNLMLLCGPCHKVIDDSPEKYPVSLLKEYKRNHEDRIREVTESRDEHQTTIVSMKSKIGGEAVQISPADIRRAVAPYWAKDRDVVEIDLTEFDDRQPEFISLAAKRIREKIESLYERGLNGTKAHHISVLALGPIPLLMALGDRLSNKLPTELYQRHRDSMTWEWKGDGPSVEYGVKTLQTGTDPTKVALILSLSGVIPLSDVGEHLSTEHTIYEISTPRPSPTFLRRREDLLSFSEAYRGVLARIGAAHPRASEIHLFPAIPAPVAISCGYERLKKAQPRLVVYDKDRVKGGFSKIMTIGE